MKSKSQIAYFPALSRFFGLSFFELARMPRGFVRLYIDALPRLQAEEQLAAIEAASFPHLKPAAQRNVLRSVERERDRRGHRSAPTSISEPVKRDDYVAAVAGIGIGFEEVSSDA